MANDVDGVFMKWVVEVAREFYEGFMFLHFVAVIEWHNIDLGIDILHFVFSECSFVSVESLFEDKGNC